MKKLLLLVAVLMVTFALAACGASKIPAEVTMDNVDEYLGRSDVQYVDLRGFQDKMASGYIAGFEFIPFFEYLEAEGVLVRTDGDWTFAAADIGSQARLKGLFDEDKTIFLMCGSGTRAGYVMAALESLGYENVINVGGIADYAGDNKVAGDGSYTTNSTMKTGVNEAGSYSIVLIYDVRGRIIDVFLDAVHYSHSDGVFNSLKSAYADGCADYAMNCTDGVVNEGKLAWSEQRDALEAAIIAANGWPGDLNEDGDFASADTVAGVSIGVSGWLDAFNDATAE